MTEGQIKSVLLKPESVRKEMFSTFIKREDLEKVINRFFYKKEF
jgi:hypothetical protein